jgi:hypothetical protein
LVAAVCWGVIKEATADVGEGGGHVKEGGNNALNKGGCALWPSSGDFDHLTSRQCRRSRKSSSRAFEVRGGAVEGGGGIDASGARKVKCSTKSQRESKCYSPTHIEREKNKIVDVTSKNTHPYVII